MTLDILHYVIHNIFTLRVWAGSSVGERLLDTQEVGGSIPLPPTRKIKGSRYHGMVPGFILVPERITFIFCAASFLSFGETCEYISAVIDILAWPRSSWTTLRFSPCSRSLVAKVCRRAWRFTSSMPAFF